MYNQNMALSQLAQDTIASHPHIFDMKNPVAREVLGMIISSVHTECDWVATPGAYGYERYAYKATARELLSD